MNSSIEIRCFTALIFSLLIVPTSRGQKHASADGFQSPLDIPITLSGNFMELRSDHFHSGLDMRTESREGLVVRAAAGGFVSRVKVGQYGYGKALYIDHPDGHTTVYGHLRNYTGSIAEAVLNAQYKANSFEVDLNFGPGELPVSAGQIIGHSGNSGGSSGPHLHFEVRRTSDQSALDPEAYGISVRDTLSPTFLGLRVDALDATGRVAPYPGNAKGWVVEGAKGLFRLKDPVAVAALGSIGFSVNVIDRYNNSQSTCGIRSMSLSVDGVPLMSMALNEVDFGLQRYANAYMDYGLYKENDMNYHRCYRLPNNRLQVYGAEPSQGRFTPVAGQYHQVRVVAVDAHGNASTFDFELRGASMAEAGNWPVPEVAGVLFRYDQDNELDAEGMRLKLPANALYQDEHIGWSKLPDRSQGTSKAPKALSPIYQVHQSTTALHLPARLSLQVDASVAPGHKEKLIIVQLGKDNKPRNMGGTHADGWLTAKIKAFGTYTVMLDTTPPTLVPLNLKPDMTGKDSLILRMGDDLSGVDTWVGRLDGKWILFEWDHKRQRLTHAFDRMSNTPGLHQLEVEVRDERGNARSFTYSFRR
jgi:murein DD-endopeptidase MepM/ murein hydrolase activator NlpD